MKKVIDNNNQEIEVSDDTVVKTINGKHYLLTPEEQAEYDANVAKHESTKLQRLLDAQIASVKQEANKRIEALYPAWKQRNYLAEVLNILSKEVQANSNSQAYTKTTKEEQILSEGAQLKLDIDNIRNKSNQLEDQLKTLDYNALKQFKVSLDENW